MVKQPSTKAVLLSEQPNLSKDEIKALMQHLISKGIFSNEEYPKLQKDHIPTNEDYLEIGVLFYHFGSGSTDWYIGKPKSWIEGTAFGKSNNPKPRFIVGEKTESKVKVSELKDMVMDKANHNILPKKCNFTELLSKISDKKVTTVEELESYY